MDKLELVEHYLEVDNHNNHKPQVSEELQLVEVSSVSNNLKAQV